MRQLASIGALSLLISLGWFAPFSVHAAVVFSQTPDNENSTAYNGSQPYTFIIIPTAVMPPGTKVKYLQSVFYFGAAKVRVSACTTNVTNPSSDLNPVVTPSNFQNCTAWSDYQDAQDGVNTFALTDEWTVPSVSQTYVIFRFQGDTNYVGLVGGGPAGATDAQTGFTMSGSFTDVPFKPHLVVRDAQISNPSGGLPQVITTGDKPGVLFIPGIEGSELYDDTGNKLWTPAAFSDDVPELYMDAQGHSVRDDIYAREGDLVRSVPSVGNVYGKMMDDFEELKQTGQISDYVAVAYDWRLPIDDVLTKGGLHNGRIYYVGPNASTTQPYIMSELKRLAREGGKVTIVAHSNGGLVAKRLIQMLGPEASEYIDKVILVASPQVGAPATIAAVMHGTDQGLGPFGVILTKSGARTFASTTPMTYTLLPSPPYFTQVDNPVITFDSKLTEWIKRYGAVVHSRETLDSFLGDSYGRVASKSRDTQQPVRLDLQSKAATSASVLHNNLDAWSPPADIQVIQVAGWGIGTLGTINYIPNARGGIEPTFGKVVDGDGVVPVPSALWVNKQQATDYWLNIDAFNSEQWLRFPHNHSTVFDIDQLRTFISDIITKHSTEKDYKYLTSVSPVSNKARLLYSLRSPLTFDLYNSGGQHTGISTTTGQIEEQIPGIYYYELGDTKYAISNIGTPVRILLNGYATSTFTFSINRLEGDKVVATTTFADIPVSPRTSAKLFVSSDLNEVSQMEIDENGTGDYRTIWPIRNDLVPRLFRFFSVNGGSMGVYLPALNKTYMARTSGGKTTISVQEGEVIPQSVLKEEKLEILY